HSGALTFERQLPPTRQFYSNHDPNTAVSDTYHLTTLGVTDSVVVLSGNAEHYLTHSLWASGGGTVSFIFGVGASDGNLRWAHTLGRDVPFSALMHAP
ncbi:MAG TPA: hypothetical protein VGR57_19265, partial [Ktedonobacterales bacterium]|nr:hypothetical protein [Ktedonobacterales bacterium]